MPHIKTTTVGRPCARYIQGVFTFLSPLYICLLRAIQMWIRGGSLKLNPVNPLLDWRNVYPTPPSPTRKVQGMKKIRYRHLAGVPYNNLSLCVCVCVHSAAITHGPRSAGQDAEPFTTKPSSLPRASGTKYFLPDLSQKAGGNTPRIAICPSTIILTYPAFSCACLDAFIFSSSLGGPIGQSR